MKKTTDKSFYLIFILFLFSVSCEKESLNPLPLTPDEWWESLSDDWRTCLLQSSSTIGNISYHDPKDIQDNTIGVNCNGFGFQDLEPLKYLQNLKNVNSYDTTLIDITALIHLKNLEKVNFSGTRISDITSLKNSTNIKYLSVNFTSVNSIDVLKDFSDLLKLQVIDTEVENIDALFSCKHLIGLWFSDSPVSSLLPIMDHNSIEILDCRWSKVSEKEIEEFKLKHPDCEVYSTQQ